MSFLSPEFALFLGLAVPLFYASPIRWRRHVLLALSYIFYVTWSAPHAALLLGVTLAVYAATRVYERRGSDRDRLGVTLLAVAGLLVLLATYKSFELITGGSASPQGSAAWTTLLLAPLGLSYFVFRLIGYLVDVYWEKVPVERSVVSLALYVAFFPQIVSGPIQRAGDFFSQIERSGRPDADLIGLGLRRILFGLFKKLVVADLPAAMVAAVHANPSGFSSLELTAAAYGFAFQLYADFSGLTDIAIGVGMLFGVTGPENFDRPFFARNVQDFWRRWHMSLTSWLTDYLFLPVRMALRRFGDAGLSIAIFCNLLAVGIWHGLRWTFVVFGAIQGVLMVVSALTLRKRDGLARRHPRYARARRIAGPLLMFHVFVFTLIVFRAESLRSALDYAWHLLPADGLAAAVSFRFSKWVPVKTLLGIAAIEWIEWARRQPRWRDRFAASPTWCRWSLYYAGIAMVLAWATANRQFIYAQF